jgi:hypothetical protein
VPPLKRAIDLKPECLQAHDFLGVAYFKSGDHQSAEEQLRILKRLNSVFEGSLSKLLSGGKPAVGDGSSGGRPNPSS